MQKITEKHFWRIIDANYNRAKEGLRVCEDICRFVWGQKAFTAKLKRIRHEVTEKILQLPLDYIVTSRDIREDVGKGSTASEFKREGVKEVFYANMQRVKESLRVLEEITKIYKVALAQDFKNIRYQLYEIEKKIIERC